MRHFNFCKSFLVITLAFSGHAAGALGMPVGDATNYWSKSESPWSPELRDPNANFLGTVALSNCSGALVRFPTSQSTDKALILTNGHCLENRFPKPGQVLVDLPSRRSFNLLNKDASDVLGTVYAKAMLYATMTDTDVALYSLDETYEEISERYGVQALRVTEQRPAAGTEISIVSGYWRRTYSCKIDDFVHELREDGWVFRDAIRYTSGGCAVIGGTSGAPIVAGSDRTVIGINNTINEDGGRCTRNNPCEVDQFGKILVRKGIGYGEQVYQFTNCLTATGNTLDLAKVGCNLPKPQ